MRTRQSFMYWALVFSIFVLLLPTSPIWAADDSPTAHSAAAVKSATDKPAETAAESPALPPYFSAQNADPAKPTWPDPTGGAAGVWATPAGDGKGDIPSKLSSGDLYDRIVHNLFSINMVWTLIAGFLVMFMQAGFAMVETGLCRAKNAAHTISMNLMIYALGCLGFWAYGFAIGWGNWFNGPVAPGWYSTLGPGTSVLNSGIGIGAAVDAAGKATGAYTYGLLGTKGFFLNGVDDVSVMALFFFMMVFMDTTATIPTGAMAERWSWKNFCLYGLWVALPYCIYANWVWGGGWLAQGGVNWKLGHGAVDFAGSGVVHAMGGIIGLAGAMVIGPRIGKYGKDGKPLPIPGHHIPMVVVGTFILAFGWFGFNPGSTLAGTDLRISVVVVNTMLASIAGALAAMVTMQAENETRSFDDVQRHVGRTGGHYRPMCLCRQLGGIPNRRDCRRDCRVQRLLLGTSPHRRSGRCDFRPRRERPLGRDLGRIVRQRQIRRRLERRGPRRICAKIRLRRRSWIVLRRCLATWHATDRCRRGCCFWFCHGLRLVQI